MINQQGMTAQRLPNVNTTVEPPFPFWAYSRRSDRMVRIVARTLFNRFEDDRGYIHKPADITRDWDEIDAYSRRQAEDARDERETMADAVGASVQ
jgi:hypothetical protein